MNSAYLPLLLAIVGLASCSEPAHRVRVLTYNIHHGEGTDGRFDLERLAEFVRAAAPDLVALQEVDRKTGRSSGVDQAGELGRLLDMGVLYGAAMPYDGGEYGEAILYRSEIGAVTGTNHALPHSDGREPRAALEAKVRLPDGAEFSFVGTHLDHEKDDADRVAQARELIDLFAGGTTPTLVTGDLNATPEQPPMELLFASFRDAAPSAGDTYPSDQPTKRIDYVLFRPVDRWRVVEARVIDERVASDHRPLLVVLELVR